MKKSMFLGTLFSLVLLCGCSAPLLFQQPYTTVEQIMSLKPGMTIAEVNRTLDISPIELFEMNDEGKTVLKYRYKTAGYLVKEKYAGQPGSSGYSGRTVYSNEGDLYAHFENGKLVSVQSEIFSLKGNDPGAAQKSGSWLEKLF